MPTDGLESALRMAEAFGLVAAGAVPVGLLAWRLGRRTSPPALPVPMADDPVVALGFVFVFLAYQVCEQVFGQVAAGLPRLLGMDWGGEAAGIWRMVFGKLLVAPVVLAVWLGFRSACGSGWTWRSAARAVAAGVAGWLLVSPAVYVVHHVAEWASAAAGNSPQEHALVKLASSADAVQAVVLFAAVAVATPLAEEVLFRGLLLGWLIRRPSWSSLPVGLAALLALSTTAGTVRLMTVGLLIVLVAGLVVIRSRPTAGAIWATATLFALVHASVWPTPVPLFLLGLALGWVAVRTGGVLAGTVLHGLFNAVSLVYLLRG